MAKYFTVRFLSGTHWLKSVSKMTEETAKVRFSNTKWETIADTEEERGDGAGKPSNVVKARFGNLLSSER
jgi:hypothetical protein